MKLQHIAAANRVFNSVSVSMAKHLITELIYMCKQYTYVIEVAVIFVSIHFAKEFRLHKTSKNSVENWLEYSK